jgi:hypothetical protein
MASMNDDPGDGHLDLVPMIDCIMLLLLFFMMTTKFTPEEKSIANILPTDKGLVATQPSKVTPPQQVNILIFPAGFQRGFGERDYVNQLGALIKQSPNAIIQEAEIRVGNRPETMKIDVKILRQTPGPTLTKHVAEIHKFISDQLGPYEKGGADRKGQDPIVIQCFSSLSWQFALVAYDAVRAYEGGLSGIKPPFTPEKLLNMREVTFSPPRIRNYSEKELGGELFEILHSK